MSLYSNQPFRDPHSFNLTPPPSLTHGLYDHGEERKSVEKTHPLNYLLLLRRNTSLLLTLPREEPFRWLHLYKIRLEKIVCNLRKVNKLGEQILISRYSQWQFVS